MLNYPINLSFKKLAIASQIYIRDSNETLLGYVKQKLFKLKEDINVFADESQTQIRFNIKADRVIDFSARYNFTDGSGNQIGSIKRQGMRSIWKANYEIADASGRHVLTINEENGWVKVVDALVGEIPIVGIFSGYMFNPTYIVSSTNGNQIARLAKQPAFLEGRFQLTALTSLDNNQESLVLLGVLAMTLLERGRG